MDLIHPHSVGEVMDVVRSAAETGAPILVVGGRTHMDKGNPSPVEIEIWTTQLDELVEYDPQEMLVVAQAGMRIGDLRHILAEGGQEWPVDAPDHATIGGVIATGVSSPRRLKVGHVRDTVVEMDLVTGDGRLIRSGARTVKNVTGFDLHRLATGSLGTLGVIVQVALKVRPIPEIRRTLHVPGWLTVGEQLLETVPLPAGVFASSEGVELRLEGWRDEVEEQTDAARRAAGGITVADDGTPFPSARPWDKAAVQVEASVLPSRLPELPVVAGERWGALLGVGTMWVGLDDDGPALEELRARVREFGGIAPVVLGPGGLGDTDLSGLEVHRRVKEALDPMNVMAPGRFWGGI